jgi:hypothetical protein
MSNPQSDDDSATSEEYELPIGYPSFRRNAIFGLSPRDTRRDELRSILSRPGVYGPMPAEYLDTGDSDQEHDPVLPSSAPVPPQWSRDFAFRPRSQSAHHDAERSVSPGNSGQISRELELATMDHIGPHDEVVGEQDDADEDESDFDLNADDYEMMEESGRKEQSDKDEEEQSQNEEEGPFWKGSGLTWAIDSLVQVRDDSGIQDMITMEHPPVYTVVCSIGDLNAGITVLELAFWQDIGKAPHKIWRPYEDLKPYTEDEQVTREYEERRRGILGTGGSTGSE